MKKFTLFILSIFLMMGTSVAQEDSFSLLSTSPGNGQSVFNVSYVLLEFNKDVVVSFPEGGIEVKRNGTEDVYKLTRLSDNQYLPKHLVQFLFDKVTVVGKDGEEELVDMMLETPGEYTYTIPAGVIKSVDGEDFPEYTSSFTICGTLGIEGVTPEETTKLEKIQLTFDKPVASVKMPGSGLVVVDMYWSPVANIKKEVAISDDKKTVTLELDTPITTEGTYNLDIYNGIFVGEDGSQNEYQSYMFTVINPNPSFSANYEEGEKVKEIKDLELTFKNVNEVKLVEGADKAVVYIPGGSDVEGTATVKNNKLTIKFAQEFTEEGIYTFFIPAGFFTMDGLANDVFELNVELYTFAITALEVVSVTPDAGPVDRLEKITVTFNQPVSLAYDEYWQQISREIKLTCGDKVYTLTNNPSYSASASSQVEYLVNAEWTGYEYKSTPVTAEGTYALDLAEIIVNYAPETYIDEWGYQNTRWNATGYCEGTFTWTIGNGTGIEEVQGEAAKMNGIYDLAGRKLENVTNAGVYIVNGKKVVVK